MSWSATGRPSPSDSVRLDIGQIVIAGLQSSARRTRLFGELAIDLARQRRPPLAAVLAYLDGNEAEIEELMLRWRLAGVRWPLLALIAFASVLSYMRGRRDGRRARS